MYLLLNSPILTLCMHKIWCLRLGPTYLYTIYHPSLISTSFASASIHECRTVQLIYFCEITLPNEDQYYILQNTFPSDNALAIFMCAFPLFTPLLSSDALSRPRSLKKCYQRPFHTSFTRSPRGSLPPSPLTCRLAHCPYVGL